MQWGRTRGRRYRWKEDVTLLHEEMRRTPLSFEWKSGWWMRQIGRRAEGPIAGLRAYAERQAALYRHLSECYASDFVKPMAAAVEALAKSDLEEQDWEGPANMRELDDGEATEEETDGGDESSDED